MRRGNFLALIWAVLFCLWLAGSAIAATFTVNTTEDTPDARPGDGACADSSGRCSLRAAIMEANALGGGPHTIILQSGQTYNLSLDPNKGDEAWGSEDDLDIVAIITIQGNGATVQRNPAFNCTDYGNIGAFRIFEVMSGGELTIYNLTIKNGCGGAIKNAGKLSIISSTITGNSARYGEGGGIYNSGTLTITNSTISGNNASSGGGIYSSGTLTITSSTISGNSAYSSLRGGGGIYNEGTLTITNSTISGNNASSGGGIYSSGTLTITSSTISENQGGGIRSSGTLTITSSTISGNQGGGIYNSGTLTITNSTISGNSARYGGGIYNKFWNTHHHQYHHIRK
jgi:CSLREA domain-containing protein